MGNTFGANLRRIRTERGLSGEQLAKILGTSKQVISRYETNRRSPKIEVVSEYARKLGIEITDLTGYSLASSPLHSGKTDEKTEIILQMWNEFDAARREELLRYARLLELEQSQ